MAPLIRSSRSTQPAPLRRDPLRVEPERGRQTFVAELLTHVRDRSVPRQEQARERVAKVIDPEAGKAGIA
jgi:hypothetical protein